MGGGDDGRATREEASKDMPRGTNLMAVYPALFLNGMVVPMLKDNCPLTA